MKKYRIQNMDEHVGLAVLREPRIGKSSQSLPKEPGILIITIRRKNEKKRTISKD